MRNPCQHSRLRGGKCKEKWTSLATIRGMKKPILLSVFVFAFTAGAAQAGEKGMMHCFAFTPIETATQADWDAFYKETDALPKKIKTIKMVWYGKLRGNGLGIYQVDPATSKKLIAGEKDVEGKVNRTVRKYGACFLFTGEAALAAYVKDPNHDAWVQAYEKVRVAGTTTYDILGQ